MNFKKIIIAVFIVISFNITFESNVVFSREKNNIVFIYNKSADDDFNNSFIEKNNSAKFNIAISIYIQCLISERISTSFNTS